MIRIDWSKSIKIPWEHEIMVENARTARIFVIGSYAMTLMSVFNVMILPLLGFGVTFRTTNNLTDPYEGYYLPLQTYYFFDYGWSPAFELVYLTQIIGSFLGALSYIFDYFFVTLVYHACARCDILKTKTINLFGEENVAKLNYKQFRIKVGKITKNHVRLIR